jgi:hypothetical protein
MSKLIPYIANANGILNKFVPQIEAAIKMAENYAVSKLGIDNEINVIFTPLFDFIPEDHIGGHTYSDGFITVTIDMESEYISAESIFETICYELCHATRWAKNPEYISSMADSMIFEGLAIAFESQAILENKITNSQFFMNYVKKIPKTKIEKILYTLKDQLNSKEYNRSKIFFKGDSDLDLPRWSGYAVGYYIVQKYLEQTGKKPNEIYFDKYDEIKKVI